MKRKYIDTDKLKAEIERYENTAISAYNPHGEDADFWYGKVVAFEDLKPLIDSLQKEQLECIYGRTLEEREKYCKFCSFICKARIEQEQSEVDLDSVLTRFMTRYAYENSGEYPSAIDIAHYFAEWGAKHTRKEE